jgi:hypothetical protein
MEHTSQDGKLVITLTKKEVKNLLYVLLGDSADNRDATEEFVDTLTDTLEEFK